MIKKLLPLLICGMLIGGMVVPAVISAQEVGPHECCKLRVDIDWKSGEVNNVDCTQTPLPDACKMKKGETVGLANSSCPLPNKAGEKNKEPDRKTSEWGMVCLMNTLYTATNWLFMILMVIAVIMIVVGGFIYITAAGDPDKASKAKMYIVYALIGIAIAVFAKVLPAIVRFIMGV